MTKKKFSAKSFWRKQKKVLLKKLSVLNCLILLIPIVAGSFFLTAVSSIGTKAADPGMCTAAVDVVLVMDRSGSMYASKCDWYQLKCVDSPACTSYNWVLNTTYDQTKAWCDAKSESVPHQSVYLAIGKITAAKNAANNFLSSIPSWSASNGSNDQSALISFATTAILDKQLSNDHALTKTKVNSLVTGGATNIGDAIKLGTQELNANGNPQANHAMILLTDGKANKPNGSGSGENATDVAYAISKASEATNFGYKIFTIGLGELGKNDEINETMLQNIANITGATYYYSPSEAELQAIYDSIAAQICTEYGSISGCVYSDQDNNSTIDAGETKLTGWKITLNNSENRTQLTDANGCYAFTGLTDGDYAISETVQTGWQQTYPATGSHQINVSGHNDIDNVDFANYLPMCGNQIVDTNEICELGQQEQRTNQGGYQEIRTCNQDCLGWSNWTSQEFCGDRIKNNNEQCDGTDGVGTNQSCSGVCTLINLPYCGDDIINGQEMCEIGETAQCQTGGYNGTKICNSSCDNWNSCQPTESCGDNIKNGPEQCDGTAGVGEHQSCSASCTLTNLSYCGDGQINQTSEQCDDSNTASGDGCSAICQNENNSTPNNSVIAGYNYQDADGVATTTADRTGLTGWIINLFSGSATTTLATTTTDSAGHFQFNNLLPGNYNLSEILLTNWLQLSAPATITLSASTTSENNNFVNYYSGGQGGNEPVCGNGLMEGAEICDGSAGVTTGYHCTNLCVLEADSPSTGSGSSSGGSGGGPTANVCGDGILNNLTEQCDGIFGTPAGYLCTNACKLQKIGENSGATSTTPVVGGNESTGDTGAKPKPGKIGNNGIAVVAPLVYGKATNTPAEQLPNVPQELVLGAQSTCPFCGWHYWTLAALLLLGIILLYYFLSRQDDDRVHGN